MLQVGRYWHAVCIEILMKPEFAMHTVLARLVLALVMVLAASVVALAAGGGQDAVPAQTDCPTPAVQAAAAVAEAEPARRRAPPRLRWLTFLPGAIR
ncbi:MAG: hypothetical protein U0S76_00225 [Pseudoxanthomonas sp.]|nr:hypothetical protein [Pseudoxanthomonas sp.]